MPTRLGWAGLVCYTEYKRECRRAGSRADAGGAAVTCLTKYVCHITACSRAARPDILMACLAWLDTFRAGLHTGQHFVPGAAITASCAPMHARRWHVEEMNRPG